MNAHYLLIIMCVHIGLRNATLMCPRPSSCKGIRYFAGACANFSAASAGDHPFPKAGPKYRLAAKQEWPIALAHVPPFCKRNRPSAMGAGQTDLNTWAS